MRFPHYNISLCKFKQEGMTLGKYPEKYPKNGWKVSGRKSVSPRKTSENLRKPPPPPGNTGRTSENALLPEKHSERYGTRAKRSEIRGETGVSADGKEKRTLFIIFFEYFLRFYY